MLPSKERCDVLWITIEAGSNKSPKTKYLLEQRRENCREKQKSEGYRSVEEMGEEIPTRIRKSTS